jgi:hypothetical protein
MPEACLLIVLECNRQQRKSLGQKVKKDYMHVDTISPLILGDKRFFVLQTHYVNHFP